MADKKHGSSYRLAALLILVSLFVGYLPAYSAADDKAADTTAKPNVVVFLIDALRPDYLGFQGYPEENAPFLAELAKQSMVFERAFSTSSWTAPSTASLFTSRYPQQHGITLGFAAGKKHEEKLKEMGTTNLLLNRIAANCATMPEVFRALGYSTFGMGANVNIGKELGFDRGFDLFEKRQDADADEIHEVLLTWKERMLSSKPFFLYVHFNDVHSPYAARKPYYKPREDPDDDQRARYLSEIAYLDGCIKKIYESMELGENTYLALLSDHGEEFHDHGGTKHGPKLYRELVQILLMVHGPDGMVQPGRVTENVSIVDLMPTLVDLAGGRPVPGTVGYSLAPMIQPHRPVDAFRARLNERVVFAHRRMLKQEPGKPMPEIWAAVYRDWHLLDLLRNRRMLFDHHLDTAEQNNIYAQHPEITTLMISKLDDLKKTGEQKTEEVKVELDEDLMETLRSLGYVK